MSRPRLSFPQFGRVALLPALILSAACTSHDKNGAAGTSRLAAAGSISGFVDVCAGFRGTPNRPAVVRVLHGGSVLVSAHVVAGDPARDRYDVSVGPGRYTVTASNWPARQHVAVHPRQAATVNFPDICQ